MMGKAEKYRDRERLPHAGGESYQAYYSERGKAAYMGKALTEVRSPQRKLLPDIVGSDHRKPTSLRAIANRMLLRSVPHGSEYDRGTGCGKSARPGLCGGCRVTGIPTAETA